MLVYIQDKNKKGACVAHWLGPIFLQYKYLNFQIQQQGNTPETVQQGSRFIKTRRNGLATVLHSAPNVCDKG